MSKKINVSDITSKILNERYEVNEEVKKLTESIEYDPTHPERMHPDIENKLRSDTHHLGGNKSLPKTTDERHYSEKIASKRYKDLITSVKRYWGVETVDPMMAMQVMQLLSQVMELERPHRAELERLAVELVREEFDVPEDQVDIDAKLVDGQISDDDMQQSEDEEEMDFESEVDIDRLNGEVQKRRMLNAIMQGAAKKGHYMFHMVTEQLTNIEPRLVGLYGKLMSMTDLTYWMIPDMTGGGGDGGGDMKGGKEKLDLSGDKPKIIAEAWILPVLLNELIKGVMELLAAHGLPEDDREAQYVIGKADTLDSEVWDMRLGPVIWEKFIDAIEGDAYEIKHFLYYEIAQLPQNEFHTFMRELLAGSNKGKQMLVDMANKVQDDIKQRASDDALGDDDGYDDIDLDDIDISGLFN